VVTSRIRVTTLVALALLNVFTVSAGVAVASLLPARLALWQIPRVAARPLALPGPALAPAPAGGGLPTRTGLARALTSLLASGSLGRHVGAIVTGLAPGPALLARHATATFAPASSEKLLTAAAALTALGPGHRFTTRVVRGALPGSVVLVGGGDPTLAARRPPPADYPQPATLASLASATAAWLRARGERSVRVFYDATLFRGPVFAPGWTPSYVTTGNVTPITSLEVDQGRLTRAGKPQDADIPTNFRPRSPAPAADAAAAFVSLLRAQGIHVTAPAAPGRAPHHVPTVAAVQSPVLSAVVGWMLRESNNVIAEDLARQVALRLRGTPSFRGSAAAVTRVLRRLGIRGSMHLVDGSGLSPLNRISPRMLAEVVNSAAGGRPALRPVLAGLPVAGFSGTLAHGQSVFGSFGRPALGMIRAKTGNLSTVASLAGIATDAGGRLLVFAFMADRFRARQLASAARVIDAMATTLARCGCR
jgi:serine-type D-Ala-D-Ala carboxypeptidase/endopeptidase (penicillin-binding protein 4)